MTVVAVLEIHMDKNPVANMKPNIILSVLPPSFKIILRAILLCKFHFWIAFARINPPINRKIYLCP